MSDPLEELEQEIAAKDGINDAECSECLMFKAMFEAWKEVQQMVAHMAAKLPDEHDPLEDEDYAALLAHVGAVKRAKLAKLARERELAQVDG